MQWGQIKSIFIISFLILNFFLLQQFLEKMNESDLDTLAQSTFQDRLDALDIELGELPESGQTATYVAAERYQWSEEDFEQLDGFENQETLPLSNNEILLSEFNEPIDLDLENNFDQSVSDIKSNIIQGDNYQFWRHYEEENVLLFFQQQNDRLVYFNEYGLLAVVLNDEGQAIQYGQTLLGELENQSEEQTVIDPMSAVEVIYNNNALSAEDEVTEMKLGYHTLFPLEEGMQVFAPTWKLTINDEHSYFVNAMEGQFISNDEGKFVTSIKAVIQQQLEEAFRSETE
ncbi:hypothetical protein CEY16_11800 [Halalkalibacillus sediminis]|uniref:Regulatory protein YycH-like domain-containing protein n=1 Tax=Halalkalibacillus sediminis TaxID=2018042 RepID=A0A2I0QSU2_9BACI|nr:two-component system regulatory protein YycI [Halalkalibacillus sediminis]PKR77407.1 hypothetical protein CEY16_11800 [Halalkalibacillus sediminis]